MSARAILTSRTNSHPFQERTVTLEQPLKIGRSVARSRPTANNAIFDCKVLSRNHALLWYEAGKFYLQDTKSSNGTFVNNVRLSKSSEESPPTPISSGDVLQFGVDVMEVTKKVTHGCIVASLQLFTPDGKEAKAVAGTEPPPTTTLHDIYNLIQYLRDAAEREEKLESKLAELQKVLQNTSEGVSSGWKILIEEDRLLARIDTLERQLLACHKTMTKEKLRDEVIQLNSEKEKYQEAAKEALRKSLTDKMEVIKKCQDLQRNLNTKEDDHRLLTERTRLISSELEQLAEKYVESERKCESLAEEFQESSLKYKREIEELSQLLKDAETASKEPLSAERVNNQSPSLRNSNPTSESTPMPNQIIAVNSNHNDDLTLHSYSSSNNTISDFQDSADADSAPPAEPDGPSRLRVEPNEAEVKTELSRLRERVGVIEDEKKGIISRLSYLITLFEDLKSVSNKSGVSDYLKDIISKVDLELRQVKNFTLGQEGPQHNNYTIETVPQPHLLISQELVHENVNAEIELDLKDDKDKDNGLHKLLEDAREMVRILKRENLSLVNELQAVKSEREKLREVVGKLQEQGLELLVVSEKNDGLKVEVNNLKEVAATAQKEVRSLENRLHASEVKVKGQMEALEAAQTDNTYLRKVISDQTLKAREWETLVEECKSHHNGISPPLSPNQSFDKRDLSFRMQEMEEELATFKDRYWSSATECSRLSQKLLERDAQDGPFYMQRGFLLFIFFSLFLAVLIALSPR